MFWSYFITLCYLARGSVKSHLISGHDKCTICSAERSGNLLGKGKANGSDWFMKESFAHHQGISPC